MPMDNPVYCELYQKAAELIGSRWTAAIVRAILGGVHHFSELRDAIPGLSDRMLAERLRELEREEIIERSVTAEMPVRIEYYPTAKGRALTPVLDSLIEWVGAWSDHSPMPLTIEQTADAPQDPSAGQKQ